MVSCKLARCTSISQELMKPSTWGYIKFSGVLVPDFSIWVSSVLLDVDSKSMFVVKQHDNT